MVSFETRGCVSRFASMVNLVFLAIEGPLPRIMVAYLGPLWCVSRGRGRHHQAKPVGSCRPYDDAYQKGRHERSNCR